MDDAKPLLTAAEVAERLGVSDDTVYRLAAAGELPHYRVGSAIRFDWAEVRAATHRDITPAHRGDGVA